MLLCLLLAWAAAVPTLGQASWPTEPHATCGPNSCYVLYPESRTFLEAWRACRELGGNLATPRTPEEARRVDSLVGTGPKDKLLWIGLQRQARHCQVQRPLRGFTWTTGDQDTAFTNWAQQATGGSCVAQRCVALEASHAHRWHEGSCTLPIDGYLCQFGFEGACPALQDEAGQASPTVYTTPFHLVSTEFEWLPFGSVAAVQCQAGRGASLLCVKQPEGGVGWSQAGPLCPGTGCGPDNGGCEHECMEDMDGQVSCHCTEGFRLAADGRSCEDPCAQAPCEQHCEPGGPQGYSCHCLLGFRPAEDEPHRCVDTDECQIAGVCQQMCVNYVGGFECYCSEGHELEEDGSNCTPTGAMGTRASQDLGDEVVDDREEEEEEEVEVEVAEAWEDLDGGWTAGARILWMKPTQPPDFGLAYRPSFPGQREPRRPHLEPTWPPLLSAPRIPYHSSVISDTQPVVISATRPTLLSARQTPIISATHPPLNPAHRPPVISALRPTLPSARHIPPYPPPSPAHRPPVISAMRPTLSSAHQSPIISATHTPLNPAHRPPVISALRPTLPSARRAPPYPPPSPAHRPPVISATHPTLSSAHQTPIISATHLPLSPAHWHPMIPAMHPAVLPDHQPPVISNNYPRLPSAHQPQVISVTPPAQPPAHQPPVTSAKYPQFFPTHPSPMFPDSQVADTQTTTHLSGIPANPASPDVTPSAHQPPPLIDVTGIRAQVPRLSFTPTVQPSLPTTSGSPGTPAHQAPVPAATQIPVLLTPLPPQSPANQTSHSPAHPHSKAPQVPREGGPTSKLVSTAVPTALAEAGIAGQSQRDDRWLLVALLVPTCVFLVVLLALGIVYCTRCGPHAPNKRITDCYRWVTHAGSKGQTEPLPPRGSFTGVQTCRTSV
ncbi:endosialin [Octodon degus]|uniref:Endosialin n=1 Tax=Octodon degus TaxID=10160 RepID=A0A6P6E3P6_OCTDE|nr:endosialin [Octodon degus]